MHIVYTLYTHTHTQFKHLSNGMYATPICMGVVHSFFLFPGLQLLINCMHFIFDLFSLSINFRIAAIPVPGIRTFMRWNGFFFYFICAPNHSNSNIMWHCCMCEAYKNKWIYLWIVCSNIWKGLSDQMQIKWIWTRETWTKTKKKI